MPGRELEGLFPFPQPPPGTPRLEDIRTVEASIRYWEAVRNRAIRRGTMHGNARHGSAAFLRGCLAALTKANPRLPASGDQASQRKPPPRSSGR